MTRRRIILLVAAATMFIVVALAGWQGVRAWSAWRSIERIEFDTASARTQLFVPLAPIGDELAQPADQSTPTPTYQTTEYTAVLAIGSDEPTEAEQIATKEAGGPVREENFADAILLWLAPEDGGDPSLVSIPRDLLIVNPCTGEADKLDRTLAGCGTAVSGSELVAVAVEDFTGIAIDHFATFNFDAFIEVIDSLGGVEICVDHALREGAADLLPSGCSTADGKAALAWIRSRSTQEFVDEEWRFVEGVSDQNRSERQQQLMFAMLGKMKGMRSPAALAGIAESVSGLVVLSESLSMGDAVGMAWDLRSAPPSTIRRIFIPTEPAVTLDGAFALRSTVPFGELLDG